MLNHPSQGSDDAQDEKQGDFPVIEEEKTQAVMLKDSYVATTSLTPRTLQLVPFSGGRRLRSPH